jgi:hypothetical protein
VVVVAAAVHGPAPGAGAVAARGRVSRTGRVAVARARLARRSRVVRQLARRPGLRRGGRGEGGRGQRRGGAGRSRERRRRRASSGTGSGTVAVAEAEGGPAPPAIAETNGIARGRREERTETRVGSFSSASTRVMAPASARATRNASPTRLADASRGPVPGPTARSPSRRAAEPRARASSRGKASGTCARAERGKTPPERIPGDRSRAPNANTARSHRRAQSRIPGARRVRDARPTRASPLRLGEREVGRPRPERETRGSFFFRRPVPGGGAHRSTPMKRSRAGFPDRRSDEDQSTRSARGAAGRESRGEPIGPDRGAAVNRNARTGRGTSPSIKRVGFRDEHARTTV